MMDFLAATRYAVAAATACCLLAGCSKPAAEGLPGLWLVEGTSNRSIEFRADGTAQMRVRQADEGPTARWVIVAPDRLELTFGTAGRESKESMSYELKGDDELTLKHASAGHPDAVAHYRRVAFDALKKYTPLPPQDWVYEDRMIAGRDKPERFASATSAEASNGSAIDLVLHRQAPDDVAVQLGGGARHTRFACTKTCEFGVRFDDEDLVMMPMEAPPDGNTDVVSFANKEKMLARLKTAHRMQVQAKIADQGVVPYDFKVDGLQLQ